MIPIRYCTHLSWEYLWPSNNLSAKIHPCHTWDIATPPPPPPPTWAEISTRLALHFYFAFYLGVVCNWAAIFRLHLPWVLEPPERGRGGGRHQQPQAGQAAHLHRQPLLRYKSIPCLYFCFVSVFNPYVFWASWICIRIRNLFVRIRIRPKAKKLRTTLISTVLWLLYDFLSSKNHVNVRSKRNEHKNQCCGSGSGIRDWVPFWPLDPGWEKVSIRIRDEQPGSYFLELRNHFLLFWGLKFLNSLRIRDPGWRQFGSGIRDGKKSDPGSGINIPDPQHW